MVFGLRRSNPKTLMVIEETAKRKDGEREEAKEEIFKFEIPFIGREFLITREKVLGGQDLLRFSGIGFLNVLKRLEDGSLRYVVNEWSITDKEREMISTILSDLIRFQEFYYDDLVAGKLDEVVGKIVSKYGFDIKFKLSRDKIMYYVIRDTLGFGLIHPLVYDPHITDIDVKGTDPARVKIREFAGRWIDTNVRFPDEFSLRQFISRVASLYGRGISEATPLVSFVYKNLKDQIRFRVAASLGGVKSDQTTVQIRKFPPKPFLFNDLIKFGTLSPEAAAAIWLLVDSKGKIAFAGPVGTGKTTLLNAALAMFDPRKKLVTIEDIEELALDFKGNSWVPYYARGGDFYEIVKFALRITPDLLILAEVLGRELGDVLASQTGHGLAFTIHANNLEEFKMRVRTLLRMYFGENASEELIKTFEREIWTVLFMSTRENRRILERMYMIDVRTGETTDIYRYPVDFDLDEFLRQVSERTNKEVNELGREFLDRVKFIEDHMDDGLEDLYASLLDWYNSR